MPIGYRRKSVEGPDESRLAKLALDDAPRPRIDQDFEAAPVIEELIQLARVMRAASARGEKLGLSEGRARLLRRPRDQRQCRAGPR